jgi:hypothetical protein
MIGYARFGRIMLVFSSLLLLAGCAGFQVRTAVVAAPEAGQAVATLQRVSNEQNNCKCFDAEATVNLSISNWSGTRAASFSGYLQTMSPSRLN